MSEETIVFSKKGTELDLEEAMRQIIDAVTKSKLGLVIDVAGSVAQQHIEKRESKKGTQGSDGHQAGK
jgi:hypothetical protein